MEIKDKLVEGFFYNCPKDDCVKELYYVPNEDKYCVAHYLYSKIIDIHNLAITDDEFKSRLLVNPDLVLEYNKDSNIYKIIENNLLSNESYIPDFVGMERHLLFSVANAFLYNRTCNHCEHHGQCKSIALKDGVHQTISAKNCKLFLDIDAKQSKQTSKVLRMYFVNALAEISCFDEFVSYCKRYNLNRDLLRSLNIDYIVFVHRTGCCQHGHSQVYYSREKARDYAESIMKSIIAESKRLGVPNTLNVKNDEHIININYDTNLGQQNITIQIVQI